MLKPHLIYLSYYFSASVIPFKNIITIIILLCCWQYDRVDIILLKSPLFIIFTESSEIVLSGEFKVSLSYTTLCFLWEIKLWNSACVDVQHFFLHTLRVKQLAYAMAKKALLAHHYHHLYDGGGNARILLCFALYIFVSVAEDYALCF